MKRDAQFWSLVENIETADSLDDVASIFLSETANIGFAFGGLVVRDSSGAYDTRFVRHPPTWLERYLSQRYWSRDPMFKAARLRDTPFHTDEDWFQADVSPDGRRILDEREDVGLHNALVLPIKNGSGPNGCCALYAGADGVDAKSYPLAFAIVSFIQARVRRLQAAGADEREGESEAVLTPRERQCLALAARGKSDWVISEILNLSERTVHHTIERAKRRFGVATRIQAIVRAINAGDIAVSDIAD